MPLPEDNPSRQPASRSRRSSRSSTAAAIRSSATVGDRVDVYATVFKDGHDTLGGAVRVRGPGAKRLARGAARAARQRPLRRHVHGRRARGAGSSRVAAWTDRIATWQDELRRKVGRRASSISRASSPRARLLLGRDEPDARGGARGARGRPLTARSSRRTLEVDVDRELARFGSWYELFPRSFGGFSGVAEALPTLAELGFDVVYLPPDPPDRPHEPQGPQQRRARARPDDVGSPWAIGSAEGGHDALNPELGTWDDFDAMVAAAQAAGIEIALDFAIQCSPDHPWLTEHPEWFNRRPDGTLKYAENPPKRYQDIYNVNFESEDWRGALAGAARRRARTGSSAASPSSASTTRTRSRSRSGSG